MPPHPALTELRKAVALAVNCENQTRVLRIGFNFSPQASDQDVDSPVVVRSRPVTDNRRQAIAIENLPGMGRQFRQQIEFTAGQTHGFSTSSLSDLTPYDGPDRLRAR